MVIGSLNRITPKIKIKTNDNNEKGYMKDISYCDKTKTQEIDATPNKIIVKITQGEKIKLKKLINDSNLKFNTLTCHFKIN